jgi:hypothetical protein
VPPSAVGPIIQPRAPSAPGVGLAYDVAAQKLVSQLGQVDQTNTRLGGVVAGIIAIAALTLQPAITRPVKAVAVLFLVGAIVQAVRASLVRQWTDAPKPDVFAKYAGDEPDYMKETFLPMVLDAIRQNDGPLQLKTSRLNWAITFIGGAVVSLILGKLLTG